MQVKKIATNIPRALIEKAVELTGLNQTQAIIEGLKQLIAQQHRSELLNLKGKIDISLDMDELRQRHRMKK